MVGRQTISRVSGVDGLTLDYSAVFIIRQPWQLRLFWRSI